MEIGFYGLFSIYLSDMRWRKTMDIIMEGLNTINWKGKKTYQNISKYLKFQYLGSLKPLFEIRVEDTKGVIRICKSKNDRQKKEDKRTNNDLQNTTHKNKDRATGTLLKTRGEHRCSGRVVSPCSTSGTRRVTLVTNPVISHEWVQVENICRYL